MSKCLRDRAETSLGTKVAQKHDKCPLRAPKWSPKSPKTQTKKYPWACWGVHWHTLTVNMCPRSPTPHPTTPNNKRKHKLSTHTEKKTRRYYRLVFCDKVCQQCAPKNSSKTHPPYGPHTLKNKHGSRQKRKIETEWQMPALQGNGGSPLL